MKIKNNKTKKPGIRLKVYVREYMVGGGKLELLRIVGETGSISAAAKIIRFSKTDKKVKEVTSSFLKWLEENQRLK